MTAWTHTTIIVPAAHVNAAREIGAALDTAGAGMYRTPLSATGALPATHYISSGMIDTLMVPLLASSIYLYGAAQQGAAAQGMTLACTQADADALVAQSDVSHAPPFDTLARLGLRIIPTAP